MTATAFADAAHQHTLAIALAREARLVDFLRPLRIDQRARVVVECRPPYGPGDESFRVRGYAEVTWSEFTRNVARLTTYRHLIDGARS